MKIEDEIKQYKFSSEYHKLVLNLLVTANRINQENTKFLKKWKLSVQQYNILRILRGRYPEPATVKEIQSRMLDKMSNASRLIEKLRLKDLVDRCMNETDRREVKITITSKAVQLLEKIGKEFPEWNVPKDILSERQAAELSDKLDDIRNSLVINYKNKRNVLS